MLNDAIYWKIFSNFAPKLIKKLYENDKNQG